MVDCILIKIFFIEIKLNAHSILNNIHGVTLVDREVLETRDRVLVEDVLLLLFVGAEIIHVVDVFLVFGIVTAVTVMIPGIIGRVFHLLS